MTHDSDNCTRIRRSLTRKLSSVTKSLLRAENQLAESNSAPSIIHKADLLKSVLHTIPKNAKTITATDWELNGNLVEITLDTKKTPLEYMQYLYKRAHRLIRGKSQLEKEIEKLNHILAETQTLLSLHDSGQAVEITKIRPIQKVQEKKAQPFRTYQATTGEKIYVGKDKESNQHISFHLAKGDDLWFHAEGVEGSHVVIKKKGDQIPPQAIEEAALLAAYFSKKRVMGTQVFVSMTKRKDLFRKKGMAPGMALMRTHSTITVELNKERIQELLNRQF